MISSSPSLIPKSAWSTLRPLALSYPCSAQAGIGSLGRPRRRQVLGFRGPDRHPLAVAHPTASAMRKRLRNGSRRGGATSTMVWLSRASRYDGHHTNALFPILARALAARKQGRRPGTLGSQVAAFHRARCQTSGIRPVHRPRRLGEAWNDYAGLNPAVSPAKEDTAGGSASAPFATSSRRGERGQRGRKRTPHAASGVSPTRLAR